MSAKDLDEADLQGLTPHAFEQLTFLLARADDARTLIVRNKDRGLDARLPDAMGRLTLRGWQAKRFATGKVQWVQCVDSVSTALAYWRPLRITFVFAHDLSALEQGDFTTKLIEAFPMVRLDFWSAEEVLRRMRDTEDGRRATTWLFERPGTLEELLATMVGKEPVSDAIAIAERQAELNRQFDGDPHLYYTAVVRPEGAPETPPAAETVASVVLVMGEQQVRYDLSERYPGAFVDAAGSPQRSLDGTDRRAAAEVLDAAVNATGKLMIEDGADVVWPHVPVGLRGLFAEGEMAGAAPVAADAAQTEPDEQRLPMLVVCDATKLGVTFADADSVQDGWDITLTGATGGLQLLQSMRLSGGTVEMAPIRWRHTLGDGPATDQLLSARVLLGALEGHEIVFEVGGEEGATPGRAIATLDEHDFDASEVEDLRTHVEFLGYACELQAWLGVPLFPPARPTQADAAELGRALGLIREPVRTGTWSSIGLAEHEDAEEVDRGDVAILQPIHVEVFGVRHYLGMELLHVEDARLDRDDDRTTLRPGTTNRITAQLHHPEEAPPEAASSKVGEGRGRVLIKRATREDQRGEASVEDSASSSERTEP